MDTQEARKVVTVVFSDVVGSTVLGDELDPESLRRLMSRYFQEMKVVLERHGGSVEKFIGDAVMAVFGVPRVHEDDALRAVRAAVEMRERLNALNEELQASWGTSIVTRTGVNTGEVVAGDPGRGGSFVAGDPVNVAARLQQSASPGEIMIGEATYRLVRGAVTAERLPPLTVKGKAEALQAWRVFSVTPDVPGWSRRLDSSLVGRDRELELLWEEFDRTVRAPGCQLVTLLGPAGVGKSRLANEFLEQVGDVAQRFEGRCLPYGEGLTFRPVVEVLRDAAGIKEGDSPEEARVRLTELLPAGEEWTPVADRLAPLLRLAETTPGIQETFWAVRKLLEALAAARPLVVVFDDIHWGEPTFLDLLDYLVDWIRDVPVLLLCLARPELLEARPTLAAARANTSVIPLRPLNEPEVDGLIVNLVGGADLPSEAKTRIAEQAEGNPLFVEEMLRMLVDDGLLRRDGGQWAVAGDLSHVPVPPTIHAVLTARLDRLDPGERAVIARAAVLGRVFWWAAVAELAPEELRPHVGSHLQSLVRKELIRPDRSDIRGEDVYRFTHVLMWDAAYEGLPTAVRADLHERAADWVEARLRDRAGDDEEILGHHLEQAHRALLELGPPSERARRLGTRAGAALGSAGRRAYDRGDMPGAVSLLSRAIAVLPPEDPARHGLLPPLAFALLETGDFSRLQVAVAETNEAAAASGDPGLKAHAVILGLWIRLFTDPEGWAEEAEREATRATAIFERLGDERGLAGGWALLGLVHTLKAEFGDAEEALEQAIAHAHAARDLRDELEHLSWVPLTVWAGPTPADEGLRRCEELLERASGDRKAMSSALFIQGGFEALLGRFEAARARTARARELLREIALTVWEAGPLTQIAGWVELLADDPGAAERELRWGVTTLNEIGEFSWLSTTAALLAEALYAQGRYQETDELVETSREAAASDDAYSQVLWRSVWAKVLARRGDADGARSVAREAVALTEPTQFPMLRVHALHGLAEVVAVTGRPQEAVPALQEAIRLADAKSDVVHARRGRRLLEELSSEAADPDR
ncbi:MAG TPA: adenylate/guanylate cyclase domain-containing protein [Nitriliruptorales bacterium]|nr:adenylate/guanylate cyclase domain-containing protein [Nitriliruptorales bacterium]